MLYGNGSLKSHVTIGKEMQIFFQGKTSVLKLDFVLKLE